MNYYWITRHYFARYQARLQLFLAL